MVLGMIPLARELLRMGSEVVMVANSLPAINDVTCAELRTLLESLCEVCPVLKVIAADMLPSWHGLHTPQPCEVGRNILKLLRSKGDAAQHAQALNTLAYLI